MIDLSIDRIHPLLIVILSSGARNGLLRPLKSIDRTRRLHHPSAAASSMEKELALFADDCAAELLEEGE